MNWSRGWKSNTGTRLFLESFFSHISDFKHHIASMRCQNGALSTFFDILYNVKSIIFPVAAMLEEDEIKARKRFVDQPGQWIDVTPPEVKKRQAKAWKELEKSLRNKKKNN